MLEELGRITAEAQLEWCICLDIRGARHISVPWSEQPRVTKDILEFPSSAVSYKGTGGFLAYLESLFLF